MAKHNTIMTSVYANGALPSKALGQYLFDMAQHATLKHSFKQWKTTTLPDT